MTKASHASRRRETARRHSGRPTDHHRQEARQTGHQAERFSDTKQTKSYLTFVSRQAVRGFRIMLLSEKQQGTHNGLSNEGQSER